MGSGTGGDAGAQYSIFQRFLAEIIENKKGFWSFNYGLGGNVFSELSYYYTTSPFFYLEILLKRIFHADWSTLQGFLEWRMIFSVIK